MKFLKYFFKTLNLHNNNIEQSQPKDISQNLTINIDKIKKEFGNSSDLVIRELEIKNIPFKYAVIYINGIVDNDILNSLSAEIVQIFKMEFGIERNYYNELKNFILTSRSYMEDNNYESLYNLILSGHTIILMDGYKEFLAINTYSPEGRKMDEPTSQTVIRGPKEAFAENNEENIALIRKRIKNSHLRVEKLTLGNVTNTMIHILYIDKIAKNNIIDEVKRRLNQISIDGILDGGYIEQLIKDNPYSIFPTIANYEKPDSVAANLLEGKMAILVDGTPYVLSAPSLFWEYFQVSEDYYHHFVIASLVRFIRYISAFLALIVPSVYIAITTFHHEMIPTPLLISIAAQREGIPFPALIGALLMEITFEILREAGIRMPRAIGPAISIVGALVLGEAAVQAGIISSVMVIVVSITAISSIAIADYSMSNAIRIIRFIFMILAATFGLYGIFMGLMVLVLHLCHLKSIGIPYLTYIAPKVKGISNDTFIRRPLWEMTYRPIFSGERSITRTKMKNAVNVNNKEHEELR